MALYVVATPIGNLDDMTIRAVQTLKDVQAIIAEDTRTYRKLTGRFSIPRKPVYSLYKGNESARTDSLIPKLVEGLNAALVSECGTPGVSDPGALLIRRALEAGVQVIPIPGPSSLTAILSISGLFARKTAFFGFLSKKNSMEDVIRFLSMDCAVVFFEHAGRIQDTLKILAAAAPRARIVIGREMTKKFEEIWSGQTPQAAEHFSNRAVKGELVVALEPSDDGILKESDPAAESATLDQALNRVGSLRKEGLSLSDAARQAAAETGLVKRLIYSEALKRS